MMKLQGNLKKMIGSLAREVQYRLPLGEHVVDLNPLLGQRIRLQYCGVVHCMHCGRETRKSFNQGYCYPCFTRLAQCDICILKPELCHYAQGTCRQPEWGEQHCMQAHYVYLAQTSALKVGITRHTQIPTRWIDQGAAQAICVFQVKSRYHAGLIEVCLKQSISDRTQWQQMLKTGEATLDLIESRDQVLERHAGELAALEKTLTGDVIQVLDDAEPSDQLSDFGTAEQNQSL